MPPVLLVAPALMLSRMIVTFLHELGHAIPALIFTRRKATIFIGAYDHRPTSFLLRSRRLDLSLARNPLTWFRGACRPEEQITDVRREVVHILAGPILPVLVAALLCIVAFSGELWMLQWLSIFVAFNALSDLVVNLIPDRHVGLSDGQHVYSDGFLLRRLMWHRRHADALLEGFAHHDAGRYAEAAAIVGPIAENVLVDPDVARVAISASIMSNDYEAAARHCYAMYERFAFNADDYARAALIEGRLGCYDDSLDAADEALRLDPNHQYALCNRGYTLILVERHDEAIEDLDAAIELHPSAYAYANRGLAKLRLGRIDEGLGDIHQALELDGNCAYAHRNLGIHHLERGETAEARVCLERAKELDPHTHMIDEYLERVAAA